MDPSGPDSLDHVEDRLSDQMSGTFKRVARGHQVMRVAAKSRAEFLILPEPDRGFGDVTCGFADQQMPAVLGLDSLHSFRG